MHSSTSDVISDVYDTAISRNPGEPEFHQALSEVLESIAPVISQHPEYVEAGILQRLVEPERQVMFRVPWVDDARHAGRSIAGSGCNSTPRSARTRAGCGSTRA